MIMGYGPMPGQGIPTTTAFIRNVRSKVFELLDYISRCETSESAMNAWRELCAFGYAKVMELDDKGLLDKIEGSKADWKSQIARISKMWDELKTSEKTEIKTNREGNFTTISIQWDSYIGEVPPELFLQGIAVMDKEKYDAVAHRLAQFWGYCEFVLYSAGIIKIEHQIDVPMPLDSYGVDQMFEGVSSRKVRKRQDNQKPPR